MCRSGSCGGSRNARGGDEAEDDAQPTTERRPQRTQQPSFPSGPVPPRTHGGAGVGQAGGGALKHAPVVTLQSEPVGLPTHSTLVWHLRHARVGRSQIGAFPLHGAGHPASARLPASPPSDSRVPPSDRVASGSDGDVFVPLSEVAVLHDITTAEANVHASTREANPRCECAKLVIALFSLGRCPARTVHNQMLEEPGDTRQAPPESDVPAEIVWEATGG